MKKLAFYIIIYACTAVLNAQDPQFLHFFNNPLYTNPAFVGSAIHNNEAFATRLNLNYRNQWPSLKGTYQTLNLSIDKQIERGGALGAMITKDIAGSGLLTTSNFSFIYGNTLELNEDVSLKGGLQLSYVNKILNYDLLTFADQINPTQGFIYQTNQPLPAGQVSFFNVGLGAIVYIKNINLGFASHNLMEPNQSFYGNANAILPRRLSMHAGGHFEILKSLKWKSYVNPNLLFASQQNFSQLLLNTNIELGRVLLGAGFSQSTRPHGNGDVAIAYLGYKSKRYRLIYSYDATTSSSRGALGGSHEFSMHYLIPIKKYTPSLELSSPSY